MSHILLIESIKRIVSVALAENGELDLMIVKIETPGPVFWGYCSTLGFSKYGYWHSPAGADTVF